MLNAISSPSPRAQACITAQREQMRFEAARAKALASAPPRYEHTIIDGDCVQSRRVDDPHRLDTWA